MGIKRVEHKIIKGAEYKYCGKCDSWKLLSKFGKDKNRWDLLYFSCKACTNKKCEEYRLKNPEKRDYSNHKGGAKERGIVTTLTFEEYTSLRSQPCHYCAAEGPNGIDRLNSSIAYIFPNCVPCCWTCNKMKSTLNYTEFFLHIERIRNNIAKKLHGELR